MLNHEEFRKEKVREYLRAYYEEDKFVFPAFAVMGCIAGCGLLILLASIFKIKGG